MLTGIDSVVKDSIKEGAELLTGGEKIQIKNKGYFYKPTVFKNVSPKMRITQEEVFGPVAPIIVADDEMQAMKLANDTQYGLGASIWTEDLDKADKLSRMVQSGIVSVNNIVASTYYAMHSEECQDAPTFLHRKSNHIFTVWQHLILLTIRRYDGKSYRQYVYRMAGSRSLLSQDVPQAIQNTLFYNITEIYR